MELAGIDIEEFLRTCWQRQPVLLRGAFPQWRNPLDPDELAGLACEEGIESRLVVGQGAELSVEHGPLAEDRFATLGAVPWTLLVQAVDHHVPDVAALVEPFRFVPDWRIDDVMVSYATDGGGVGPHFDQYDVFLVQGLGRRRWRTGPRCTARTPLLPHEDLRLLAGFEPTGDWVLEPGDVLYVPPGFAHDGVAVGDDCMTYSIGFRAPSRADLLEGWSEHLAGVIDEDDRYADPGLARQPHPGEIGADALDRLHAMVVEAVSDRAGFARWFGAWTTRPKYAEADWRPEEMADRKALRARLDAGEPLLRNPASRFAFVRQGGGASLLFVDGQAYGCSVAVAEALCAGPVVTVGAEALELVATLVDAGALAFDESD